MNKTICAAAISAAVFTGWSGVHAQNTVKIEGNIKGLEAGKWVYVNSILEGGRKDSVQSSAGGFSIALKLSPEAADMYVVHVGPKYSPGSYIMVYLDKGDVSINGDGPMMKGAVATGGEGNTDMKAFDSFIKGRSELAQAEEMQKKAGELYKRGDTAALKALEPELNRLDSLRGVATEQWIASHPGSAISAYLLSSELQGVDAAKRAAVYDKLTADAKAGAPAKRLEHTINVESLTAIGKPALDFTQADTAGRPVSLKNYRGKYVLLDFWASWCGPCRAENPNVVAAYNKYKNKNFTVLSVSLDQPGKKQAWLDAIHKDHLTWTHISDLQFWNNAVAKQYDIEGVPANFLLDPNGMIIGKNLRGDELNKKLSEVLN